MTFLPSMTERKCARRKVEHYLCISDQCDIFSGSHWLDWLGPGKISNRCIIPRSSCERVWQCITKQPTVVGLKCVRKVIEPNCVVLMFGWGASGPVGVGMDAGTRMVSCHSGVGRGLPLIFVSKKGF